MKVQPCQVVAAVFLLGALPWIATAQEPTPTPAASPQEEVEDEADEKDQGFDEKEPVSQTDKQKQEAIKKKACPVVDVKFKADTDKTRHPLPDPKEGHALVYVIRSSRMGSKVQTKLGVDGAWGGVNRARNYFTLDLPPGEHYFCSKAENTSVMALSVEAGRTYYVEQKIKMGFMKARNKLEPISEALAKEKLAKAHPSTWEAKK